MSKKIIVKITWSIKQPLEMSSFALGTVTAMADDDDFLSPDIALITMNAAANKVQIAYGSRKNGIVAKDNLKNTSTLLNGYLHSQAEFVNKIANGNASIIHNAGFESTSDIRGAGTKPNRAGLVTLRATSAGGMKAQITKVKGATNYCFILVANGDFNVMVLNGEIFIPTGSSARIINTTKRAVSFANLNPMEVIRIAVIASNAAGDNGISPVSTASTIL